MKIIAVTPARNEARLLPSFLTFLSSFADYIIIADQESTDGSTEIYKQFPKVSVIQNHRPSHSNEVRWDLLTKAREIEGENIIVCLDVDERIPAHSVPLIIDHLKQKGSGFNVSLPWIQLWKKPEVYRTDWPWGNNYKACIFYDDRIMSYEQSVVINDHTNRIPTITAEKNTILPSPLLHLQYLYWNEVQLKQAWYRCKEYIADPTKIKAINLKYESSLDTSRTKLSATPPEWIDEKSFIPTNIVETTNPWHLQELHEMFKTHSIAYFEPIDMWHIQTLQQEFQTQVGRKPHPTRYNSILRTLYYILQSIRQNLKHQ
ncbi:MAG TPA: glycosyltransferase family 2 protein [Candidatus Paceibacterota bacterium]|nr:glycosyltransferase family 2 protein [Candidatus Paceibacterota bacterium]